MKIQFNKILSNPKNLKISKFSIFCLFTICVALTSTNLFAQSNRPKPKPEKEIPVIISRDTDSVPTTRDEDVVETSDSRDSIDLPRTNSTTTNNENPTGTSTKQKKMMLYLDILTRTEQRASSLQNQLIDLLEKHNALSTKVKELEIRMRPESISASMALTGSLRPEDLREQKKQLLELEKKNIESLLQRLEQRRSGLEESVRKADALVEKIRVRFDKIIDDALTEDEDLL